MATSRQEIEEAIINEEQSMRKKYHQAEVAMWVVVRKVKQTEKAVKVMAKVIRDGLSQESDTSQFWIPKSCFFRCDGKYIVVKKLVDQKLAELHEVARSSYKGSAGLARPIDLICLPEADWAKFFSDLRAQIPASDVEHGKDHKKKTAQQEVKKLARDKERKHAVLAKTEPGSLFKIELAQVSDDAAKLDRIHALETRATNATVHGKNWVKNRQLLKAEKWTLQGVTVKVSGERAYILDATGTVICFKPLVNIAIDYSPEEESAYPFTLVGT